MEVLCIDDEIKKETDDYKETHKRADLICTYVSASLRCPFTSENRRYFPSSCQTGDSYHLKRGSSDTTSSTGPVKRDDALPNSSPFSAA